MSDPVAAAAAAPAPAPQPAPPRRRPVGWIVTAVILAVSLIAIVAVAVWLYVQRTQDRATIDDQQREIEEQQQQLDEQRDLIDRKEAFGAAVENLLGEVESLRGMPLASVVPWDSYDSLAWQAWSRRWDLAGMDQSIRAVEDARTRLAAERADAANAASVNASGSAYEAALDALGQGYVTWSLDDVCSTADAIACVRSSDPRVVHVDVAREAEPYMTDRIRTGVAYHEFAHVLQFTNPEPTATALEAFGGDAETMADCFALTFLDGWTLDSRVWDSDSSYWEVSIGYGVECDDAQKQVIRDWRASLGVQPRVIGPGAR